ncbi:hypothetical protein ASG92_22270 [Arthrobacter sp. Soil736]|uniref:phage tail protein n=1 Tax=Arthrobacter sp. Soil736 TaxID=1736395 RepID=UPI0006F4AD14|nr:phage tail protein [Arthrobacter sp. Soil736]KRE60012.1 hypothetical protein ASG92_22270 [Arthrobacter sp. Soil736]
MAETKELLATFRFTVTLTRSPGGGAGGPALLGTGAFAECTGLDLEADIKEYAEGGRNFGMIRMVGRSKSTPLVLKRGMVVAADGGIVDSALWDWISAVVTGRLPIPRYDGLVQVHDPGMQRVLAQWSFERGLPGKVSGPVLNAKTGEVAIEELQILHEGLRMVVDL